MQAARLTPLHSQRAEQPFRLINALLWAFHVYSLMFSTLKLLRVCEHVSFTPETQGPAAPTPPLRAQRVVGTRPGQESLGGLRPGTRCTWGPQRVVRRVFKQHAPPRPQT